VTSSGQHAVVDFTPVADAHAGCARVRNSFICTRPTPDQIDSISDLSCSYESPCSGLLAVVEERRSQRVRRPRPLQQGADQQQYQHGAPLFSILDMFLLIKRIQVASASCYHPERLKFFQVSYHHARSLWDEQ